MLLKGLTKVSLNFIHFAWTKDTEIKPDIISIWFYFD